MPDDDARFVVSTWKDDSAQDITGPLTYTDARAEVIERLGPVFGPFTVGIRGKTDPYDGPVRRILVPCLLDHYADQSVIGDYVVMRGRFLSGARVRLRRIEVGPVPGAGKDIPQYAYATKPVQAVMDYVATKYRAKFTSWGVCNCRYIAGTQTWSQHAWCNGWDIHPVVGGKFSKAQGDIIAADLKAAMQTNALPIAQVFWYGEGAGGHYDHIHVTGEPMKTGTPPCAK